MFGKKSALDPKKVLQKFLDPKKDPTARLKYLKTILDIVDVTEAKTIFEANFSNVYYVFYDQFISVESNLQQRAHKNNREEFDVVLSLFEKILTLLPELLSRKWQCRSISRLMKKLLHPGNALKLRREAMRLFLLWYQILGENSPEELHWLFACLVPGFQVCRDHDNANLESIISETATSIKTSASNIAIDHVVCPVDICPILPPQSGDRQCEDLTRFFLENLMECMVTQIVKIEWRDKSIFRQQKCFQFLFDKFKKMYLPTIFPNFDWRTNIFMPCLELPEMRSQVSGNDSAESNDVGGPLSSASLLHCKVVVVRWFANFTNQLQANELADINNTSRIKNMLSRKKAEDSEGPNENKNAMVIGDANSEKHQSSPLTSMSNAEKESSQSYNANEDHTVIENAIVRETLYFNRDNINFMHEVFRQALLLPLSEAPTIRRVISVYRDWITNEGDFPSFMFEPNENAYADSRENKPHGVASNSDVMHSIEGSRSWRPRNDSYLGAIHKDNLNIRAGLQKTLQLFITHAANVFLQEIGPGEELYLDNQVDMCKRVLNIYRFIVMNIKMEQRTWEQLLVILLHITSQILGDLLPSKKEHTLGGRLAPALFQTLIVTWIKANLNVVISMELWDQFLHVLSSLTHWEELIREWGKTMETLTRVLARLVYGLDLNDLPLDRLSEQKLKRRRGKHPTSDNNSTSFSKGWSRHGLNGAQLPKRSETGTPDSSKTFDKSMSSIGAQEKKLNWQDTGDRSRSNSGDVTRKRRHRPFSESEKGSSMTRSISEGNLSTRSRSVSFRISRHFGHGGSTSDIAAAAEQEVASILAPFEDYLKETNSASKVDVVRKAKSLDSLRHARASSPSSLSDLSVDGPSRSPSPSPSTGLESNSIKDSPMQIDVIGGENPCASEHWNGSKEELRSIMSGGKRDGWLPDVAVVLWKRMLGALGDVNKISDSEMHAQVFQYLVDLFETLVKMRENQGVTTDNQSTPAPPELTPPLNILAPWLFKAVSLPSKYKKGKLWALRLLCSMTVRRHDLALRRDHLVQFYGVLHSALCGSDQEVINTIIKYCGPQFFSLKLDGSSLLVIDFIHAADTIVSSATLKNVPRTEAMCVLGALVCFPNIFVEMPVLQQNALELVFVDQKSVKDQILNVLLKSGRHEPAGLARCVALSSLGIYLYEELTHNSYHGKMREAVDVLLAALRITNQIVGQVACDMLYLLTNHVVALMKNFPDVPKKIVEVLSTTLNDLLIQNSPPAELFKDHEQLVISMMFCLGEWCMNMPSHLLLQHGAHGQQLLSVVFKVLTTAVFGNSCSDPQNVQKLEDMNSDFDVNILFNDLKETSGPGLPRNNGLSSPEHISAENFCSSYNSPIMCEGRELNMVKLTAKMIISHLSNHLGHFPMGIGAARLASMVNETDDIPGLNTVDLTSDIFHAPNVQLFVLNNKTLISFVELPTLDVPGGGVTAGLTTAKSQVRVILRDMSGKFSWDTSVLYSPPALLDYSSGSFDEFSTEDKNVTQLTEEEFPNQDNRQSSNARLLSMGRQHSQGLPTYEDASENPDCLNDLLQHIGMTSPECLYRSGQPLNIPQELPPKLCSDTQENIMTSVLNQRNYELDYHLRHKNDVCMTGRPTQPRAHCDPSSPFHHCRLLINQMGLMQWEKRTKFDLLKKNEKLIRELRNLDNQKCRETHKIAVIYVADGQEDKNSVLMNMGGGQAYEEFVAGLAWEVELPTHTGFMGGLQANGSTGDTAPYYATSFMEVIFHVATRMPSNSEESKIQKLRHLGNDEVHIVWSEHQRDYRHGIITTEFGDVLIVIYPLPNKLYRIQITRKPAVPFFGPLFDGAIVDHRVLPGLVRATAINASRATRSTMPIFQHFYKERAKALETIIKNHKDNTTFEDFTSSVVMPAQCKSFHHGQSCSVGSGFKCDSSNVLALSNLTAALLDSHTHHSFAPIRSRPSSLSSSSEQSTPATIHDAHYRVSESFDSIEREDVKDGKAISPKTSKRLSFKSNMKKSHPPRMGPTPPESPPRGKK